MGVQSREKNNEEQAEDFESEGGKRKNPSHTDVTKEHKEKLREEQYGTQTKNQLIPFKSYGDATNGFNVKLNNERLFDTAHPRLWNLLRELIYHKQMFTNDSNYQIEPQRQVELYNDIIYQFPVKEKTIVRNFAHDERKLQKFNDIKSSSGSIKNYQEPRKSKNFNQLLINRMLEVVALKIQNKQLTSKMDFNNNLIIPNTKVHTPEFLLIKREDKKSKMITLDEKKKPENIYQMGEEQERRVEVFRKPPEGAMQEYFAERENISYEYKKKQSGKDKKGSCHLKSIEGKSESKCEKESETMSQNQESLPDSEDEQSDELSKPKKDSIKYSEDAQVEQCCENPVNKKSSMSQDSQPNPDFIKDSTAKEMSEDTIRECLESEHTDVEVEQCPMSMDSENCPDVKEDYMESEEEKHEESMEKLFQSKTEQSDELSEQENDFITHSEDAQMEQCCENPVNEKGSISDDLEQNLDFKKDLTTEEMSESKIQEYLKGEQIEIVVTQCLMPMDSVDCSDCSYTESEEDMNEESKDKLLQSKTESSHYDKSNKAQQSENDEDMTESSPNDPGFFEDKGQDEDMEAENTLSADTIHEALGERLKINLEDPIPKSPDSGYCADSLPDLRYEDSEKPTVSTAHDAGTKILPEQESGSVHETVKTEDDLKVQKIPYSKQQQELQKQYGKDVDLFKADLYQNTISKDKDLNEIYTINHNENNQKKDLINYEIQTEKYKEPKNFHISEQRMSANSIKKLAEKINSHGEIYKLEFCDCNLTKGILLSLIKQIDRGKCKMMNLMVGYVDNVTDLFPEICEILFLCKPEKLSLECDDLKDRDMKILYDCLRSKSDSKIKPLKEVDVSYNEHLGEKGFFMIGEIMHEQNVNSLKAANCNITDEAIVELREGLHGTKVFDLDISGSKQMSSGGYANLAQFITDKDVKRLNLSDCQMTTEKVQAFCTALIEASEKSNKKIQLEDLDISYNPLMDPEAFKNIGSLVWKCGVKKLSLAGCQLDKRDLVRLREVKEKKKMTSVDAADNVTIGEGIIEIAKIVNECDLEELNLSDCMFSARQLAEFKKALGAKAKLKILDLSDYDRSPNEEHILEICKLFPKVTHELRLQFRSLSKSCRRLLQHKLNKLPKTELKIIVDDDNGPISWQDKDGKT